MIRPAEIQKKANKERVRDTQIEKDYILTWILTGVAANEVLCKALAFKGGTVLKKFYFKDYRYSEDLDFTLVDDGISNEAIQTAFAELFQYVREEANIPLAMSVSTRRVTSISISRMWDRLGELVLTNG